MPNILLIQVVSNDVQERRPLRENNNLGALILEPLLDKGDKSFGLRAVFELTRDFKSRLGHRAHLRDFRRAEGNLADGTRQRLLEGHYDTRFAVYVCARADHGEAFEIDGLVTESA